MTVRKFLFTLLFAAIFITNSECERERYYSYAEQGLFTEAVNFIIEHEGWHGKNKYPYVGYGHRLTKKDRFNHNISRSFARKLVVKDLKSKCAVFRPFGKDSLLLGILAYNVGEGAVNRSKMMKKIRSGKRPAYSDYVSFCYHKNKLIPSIKNRRIKEYNQFYNKTKLIKHGFKSR